MTGYKIGPTLAPDERPWPIRWERDPTIDDGHAHDWECCLLGASERDRVEEVVRCATCHAPRCGDSGAEDPCMERRHHSACHRRLSGRREHLGDIAATCGCPIGATA